VEILSLISKAQMATYPSLLTVLETSALERALQVPVAAKAGAGADKKVVAQQMLQSSGQQ
jgi:hypothetical protein